MNIEIDGQSVFVGQGGVEWRAELPTLFMMHGAGMDRTVWVLLGRYFARHGYNVVLADLPGHGFSGGKPLTTIGAMANWVWTLLDTLAEKTELSLDDVSLCGHSMGSLVCLQAAADRPDTTKRLILMASGYPMPVGKPLLDAAEANDHAAIDMICFFSHAYSSMLGHNPVAGINVYNSAEVLLAQAKPGVLFTALSACNNYQGGEDAIEAVKGKMDVVVIAGDSDRMTPLPRKPEETLHARLDATLTLIPDCGHMMMAEQPEASLQALRKCLSVTTLSNSCSITLWIR